MAQAKFAHEKSRPRDFDVTFLNVRHAVEEETLLAAD